MFDDRIVFDAERAHGDPAFAAGRQVEERRCGESGTVEGIDAIVVVDEKRAGGVADGLIFICIDIGVIV